MMAEHEPLAAARTELHWAARILSAAADAMLEKAADDSHSNLGWDSGKQALVSRVGAHIHVPSFSLHHGGDSLELHGRTLDEGMLWLGQRVGAALSLRTYDAPAEARGGEEPFVPKSEHLLEIAEWLSFAALAMADMGELRVWPHHFDLGFFQAEVVGDASIGGGFALGDEHYPVPYFYVNPYGVDRPTDDSAGLPRLAHGSWTDKWFGAVLTALEFEGDAGMEVASSFLGEAMSASIHVLSTGGGAAAT